MSKIVILDETTANQISAGEVIERPASVVKEMVENSIDAGADVITVEIKNGGIAYIRVTDNGAGMEADDVEIAFERHATSKIRRIEDLGGLSTMGFRGEALASIVSVSHLEVTTKTEDAKNGIYMKFEGGRVAAVNQVGCPKGTSFIVRDLFYNTPARYKFLKKDSTEAGYVSDIIERLALAHPEISFKLIQNSQVQMHTPGNNDLQSVIYSIYGNEIAKKVVPVEYENEGIRTSGFTGLPEIARGSRNRQSFYINGRYIKSRMIASAIEDAYKTFLMQNKFPFCVLFIAAPPESFDVNVHPQKLEVRFSNEGAVYSSVYHAIKNALLNTSMFRSYEEEPVQPASRILETDASDAHKGPAALTGPVGQTMQTDNEPISRTNRGTGNVGGGIDNSNDNSADNNIGSGIGPAGRNGLDGEGLNDRDLAGESGAGIEQQAFSDYRAETPSRDDSLRMLSKADIVGQAFDTYILLQNGDTLYIIDQHAAHERIRYETLRGRLSKEESFSQGVLEPYIIKLSSEEFNFVKEKKSTFARLGFDIEEFGLNTVILRSVPDIYDSSFSIADFQDILDRWMQTKTQHGLISDEALYMMSCKGAIKANRVLSAEEIRGLIESLCSMENPFTCVHGRPVVITMEKRELEKKFKRIV